MKIGIIEDDTLYSERLEHYLKRFGSEQNQSFEIIKYSNAVAFLDNYPADFSIVFMDIHMPYMNGMDAARKLRELDKNVMLIFVTNLTQYAISGYEVEAFDYILKPINYYDFALKLSRALRRLPDLSTANILFSMIDGMFTINPSDIYYAESAGHHVIYHCKDRDYTQYASLTAAESKLSAYHFVRCNNCYLVNLSHVQKVKGYTVTVAGTELQISQPRKKSFIKQLAKFAEGSYK